MQYLFKSLRFASTILLPVLLWHINSTAQVSIKIGEGMKVSGDNGIISISGHWINKGTFVAGDGSIIFDGTSMPEITNPSGEKFNNLTVNKLSGELRINNKVAVNGTLVFINGNINTGSDTLILGSSAMLSGEGSGNYVVGILKTRKTVGTGSSILNGIGVELDSGVDDIGDVMITRVSGAVTVNEHTSINRSWVITTANPPSNGRNLTLSWVSDDDYGDLTKAQVWKSTDSGLKWFMVGEPQNVIESDPRQISVNVNSFSSWTVTGRIVPAKPTLVDALPQDDKIILYWRSNTESNLSHYKIYRSQTNNFVPSPGDSLAVVFTPDTTYEDTDVIVGQTYYYRISAVDSTGNESEFSDQVSATPRAGPTDSDIFLPITQYDFGSVLVDSSKTWKLTVKNLGSGALEIYDIQNSSSAFSVSPKTASIAELDSFNFTLVFSPVTESTFQDTFRISSNDPDEATVLFPVTGKAVIAPQPSIFISETSHNFGDVPVLSSASWQVTFENKGAADLVVQNIASSNPVFSSDPKQFAVTPSGRQEVQMQFTPDSLLAESGNLTIHSNDPDNPEMTVSLSGVGIDSEPPLIPDIYLPVTQYDFGSVLVDSSKTWKLTVKNLGSGALEIYDIQNSVSAFSVSPKTASIAELDSFNFTLVFSPVTESTFQDTFRISSNDPDEDTVLFPVRGKGVIAPQPAIFISETSHNFGNVPILSSSSWQVTFENKGNADLLVQNIASSNPVFSADPKQFAVTPSGRQEVQVQFTPDSLLSESGVLSIHSNDPENPEMTVNLSGVGIDSESPQISVQPFTTTMQASTAFSISAEISDNWEVASAYLFYRKGSENSFRQIEMSEGAGQHYSAALPASAVTLQGLAFFIRAEDSAGNISATDTLSSPIRFSDGALTTGIDGSPYASGYPGGEWRMISAPANLDEKTVAAILLDETALGSYGEPNWRLFSFEDTDGDGANDGYAEYQAALESTVFSFFAGKAFWLKANPEGGAIHIDAGPGQVLPLETKSITLSPGWNQVGNPFAFPISFSPTNENIVDQLYAPDGAGGYELTTVLQPWAGYFVFVNGNSSVELSFEPESETPLRKIAESETGWRLRINAECGGSSDRINYLGVSETGSDSWDKQDYPEPPVLGNYVSLYFPHADWPGRCKAYTSDFRQSLKEGQIWDLRVKSNEVASVVRLNWAVERLPETDMEVVLYDKNRNKTIDMNSYHEYSFQRYHDDEEAGFQVFAGSPGFIGKQVGDLRAQFPQEFGLSQNYPNPFNATTRIDFKIPSLQRVSLKIYDLLGREVKSLVDDVRPAGYYHIVWNGRNNAGAEVSSGIYVCLVRAGEQTETRKVILMK